MCLQSRGRDLVASSSIRLGLQQPRQALLEPWQTDVSKCPKRIYITDILIWRHTVIQKRMCAKVPFRSDERPLVRLAPQLICPMSHGCCFVFLLNRGRSRSERLQRFTRSVWLTLFFLGAWFSCKFAPELYQASCVMLLQKYMQSTLTLCAGTSSTDTRFLPPWKPATRLAKKFKG